MITLFRRIRQKLIDSGSVTKYLLYALGEISLVVIGILLALQINTWNEQRKDRQLEKRFLSELMLDLQADSLTLAAQKANSDLQIRSKDRLRAYMSGTSVPADSLIDYFHDQWKPIYSFNPITTTLDEMRSTGNLGVIENPALRRTILETYNEYENYISEDLYIYNRQQEASWELFFSKVPRLYAEETSVNPVDITSALDDFEIRNRLLGNYAIGLNNALEEIIGINLELLQQIRYELSGSE